MRRLRRPGLRPSLRQDTPSAPRLEPRQEEEQVVDIDPTVRHADGRASVTLELSVRHGAAMPELARAVQERVTDALARTGGLEVERVDVEIDEVA